MRHYETIYIVNPNLSDEDYNEILEKNIIVESNKPNFILPGKKGLFRDGERRNDFSG